MAFLGSDEPNRLFEYLHKKCLNRIRAVVSEKYLFKERASSHMKRKRKRADRRIPS